MSQNNPTTPLNRRGEISSLEILRFLKGAWKIIAIFGVAGMVLAIANLVITPKQYEASAQIIMAQIGSSKSGGNPNTVRINIEEPALLVARLSSPTSFTPQVIEACGYQNQPNDALALSKSIKLTVSNVVANVVELKMVGSTPEAAHSCANAVFELIKATQAQIVAPYVEEAKIKLADYEGRLTKAKELVDKSDRSGLVVSATYFSTRDEIRHLLGEISDLKSIVTTSQYQITRLVAPIYAGDAPIAPKKRVALATGLLGGLCLGLLVALTRKEIPGLKGKVDRTG